MYVIAMREKEEDKAFHMFAYSNNFVGKKRLRVLAKKYDMYEALCVPSWRFYHSVPEMKADIPKL